MKNILMLINGFGIEQADSYNIYGKDIMPNLDRLTNEWLFSSLQSKELDYKDGYRKFSIGINESLTYNIIEQSILNESYNTNMLFNSIITELSKTNRKLHIFCFYENDKTIKQLLAYLKKVDALNIKVLVHLIFCQKSLKSYKDMDNNLVRLNYEFNNIKIGIVTGFNNVNDEHSLKDINKALITNIGEKWNDLSKKIKVLNDTKTLPYNARTFIVGDNINIDNEDKILFYNYFQVDVIKLINEISNQSYNPKFDPTTIKYFSLFPTISNISIPFMYNYAVSSTYFLTSLKSISAKCLVFDNKDKTGYINYYMTGLRGKVDPDLQYYFTDDNILYNSDKLLTIINSVNHELIILNYEIDTCKTIDEIKEKLIQIDSVIGQIEKLTLEKDYGLFISSLYGMEKELMNSKLEVHKVNFSSKVPIIVVDKSYSKINYSLLNGTLYDLSNTIIKNINQNYKTKSLIKKKSSLLSIFYKKKKEGKK